ncbi:hypothetical protein HF290_15975 [Acidithiobacillus ferrooxidans]|nr:hypothetical protein [Acidithiobacillus ferrooxidans]
MTMAGLVGQTGFFPGDRRLRELDLLGDGLPLLNRLIPWERFRPILESVPKAKPKGPGGRKPYDRTDGATVHGLPCFTVQLKNILRYINAYGRNIFHGMNLLVQGTPIVASDRGWGKATFIPLLQN